jgi:hypothetical protein
MTMRRVMALPALAALLSCAPAPPPTAATHRADAAAACRARGGSIQGRAMFGNRRCVIPFADAGRSCTDSGQCAGRCLHDYRGSAYSLAGPPPEREGVGRCEADDSIFGCHSEIRNGRIMRPVCVD